MVAIAVVVWRSVAALLALHRSVDCLRLRVYPGRDAPAQPTAAIEAIDVVVQDDVSAFVALHGLLKPFRR